MTTKFFLCTILLTASIFASEEPKENLSYSLIQAKGKAEVALVTLNEEAYSFSGISDIELTCYFLHQKLTEAHKKKFVGYNPNIKIELLSWQSFSKSTPAKVDRILDIYQHMLKRYADKAVDSHILINQKIPGSSNPAPAISAEQKAEIEKIKNGTRLALITCSNLESIKQTAADIQNLIDQIPEQQEKTQEK